MARRAAAAGLGSPGLQEMVQSVYDIERVVRAMVEVGGYRLQSLPDASPEQFRAWKLTPPRRHHSWKRRIEQALLVPPTPSGMGCLRLVRFHGLTAEQTRRQRVMRSSQRSWDTGGIFDIDVFARDVDELYRGFQRHGWTAFGEPVEYREAEFHVKQVVAVGPDGLLVAAIQRYQPPPTGLDADMAMTAIFNSTQMVRDFERATQFYERILGWRKTHDFVVDAAAEPGADVLGLPMPQAIAARRRIGMYKQPDGGSGAIELIENSSMRGRDFSADCVAPNVGLLALRFAVANAGEYAEAIVARGGELYTPLMSLELAPYGTVALFAVRSPEGAIIEFIQGSR